MLDTALDSGGPVPVDRHPDRHQVNGTPLIRPSPRVQWRVSGACSGREGVGGGLQHHLVRQLTEDHEVLAGEAHFVGGTEPIVELHHRDNERLLLRQFRVAGGDALAEVLGEFDGESCTCS